MDAENFAEWLRRQGHQVFRTQSSYWYDAGPRVLQAFPYHWLIQPSRQEIQKLVIRHSILALRYSTLLDAAEGMASYHVILNDHAYDLSKLKSQARNGVKKGLASCQIEQISFNRLAEEGWNLQQDTLDRQNRLKSMEKAEWEKICLSAQGLSGFEAWGAIVNGELAASIIICRIDDTYYVPYAQSHRKYLVRHVNNALFYKVSCDLLSRKDVKGIFFSTQSLDAPESVNEFKFRMSFFASPVRQCIVFYPLLRPFANHWIYRLLQNRIQKDPANPTLAKMEGMLRFYLQGKLPLNLQNWPECLADQAEKIGQAQRIDNHEPAI